MLQLLAFTALLLSAVSLSTAQDKFAWIAHRGESHDAPENTLAAFNLAWQRGTDACELDTHLTKDGQLIICHDADTERTAGQKLIIKDSTLQELRKLDVGSWKSPKYAGEKMPTLAEALATIPDGKRFFLEVKVGVEAIPELVRVIKASGKKPQQLPIISFKEDACAQAKKQLPEHEVCFLSSFKQDKKDGSWHPTIDQLIAKAKELKVDGLDLRSAPPLDAAAIAKIKAAGLTIYAWTVDDPAEARKLIEGGIQGITTNRSQWLREQVLTSVK